VNNTNSETIYYELEGRIKITFETNVKLFRYFQVHLISSK